MCFGSSDSIFPIKTRSVCMSKILSSSHWIQKHLLRVFNSLDGNYLHIDAPLKHAVELGVFLQCVFLLHKLITQGLSWRNTTFSLHFVRKSTILLPVVRVIVKAKPECLLAENLAYTARSQAAGCGDSLSNLSYLVVVKKSSVGSKVSSFVEMLPFQLSVFKARNSKICH